MKRSKPLQKRQPPVQLSREDRILWNRVAQTTTPLSRHKGQFLKDEMAKLLDATSANDQIRNTPSRALNLKQTLPEIPASAHRPNSHSSPIEERLVKNLVRGRQPIDARIDLHGMTQDRARFALLDFLQMAQQADYKLVLVITGKGTEGRGVLRGNVPRWLALPAFTRLVNGYRESHSAHGGEGALYVRIRKANRRARP